VHRQSTTIHPTTFPRRDRIRGIVSRACLLLGALAFVLLATTSAQAVVINEFLAWNWNTVADEDGDYEDWIELYNPSALAVPLAGYALTDCSTQPAKWTFPAVSISGYGCLLVWASNKNRAQVGLPLHTNFRLENRGEFIGLYNPSGALVDSVTFGRQCQDISCGRKPDGSGTWMFFSPPTPGVSNNAATAAFGIADDPVFTPGAGFFGGSISVQIASPTPGSHIHYTTDGADPTEAKPTYTGLIPVTTATVIRAQVHAPPLFPSRVVTQTYLVNVPTTLPVMSVVTDPNNLWGGTGIYYAALSGVAGERPCSVEYWEEGAAPGFSMTCGLRVRGGASQDRDDIHKKSFMLCFRREQGPAKLDYPLFDSTPVDRFDKVVLRANYNDSWAHHMELQRSHAIFVRDELMRKLRLELGDLGVHGGWCLLYLNGRFWGIYNPCERVESDFLDSYTGQPDWDILSLNDTPGACILEEGTRTEWDNFSNWFAANNLGIPANYQQLQTMLDLSNYTNYMLGNIIARNDDWPHHNGFVARPRQAGAKWTFLDWDVEYAYGTGYSGENATVNMMDNSHALRSNLRVSNLLKLLIESNHDYRVFFAQRMDVLLNTAYDEPHVVQQMNELAAAIRPAVSMEGRMPGLYHGPTATLNVPPYTYTFSYTYTLPQWEQSLTSATKFINQRTYYVRLHTRNKFASIPGAGEITGWQDVKVLPPQGGEGDVLLHSILPTSYPWKGTFFRGIPLVLRAVPKPGYVFDRWSTTTLPNAATTSIVLSAAQGTTFTFYAQFAVDPVPPSIASLEFVARNRLAVTFSRAVERPSAETAANYSLNLGGGQPTTATLQTSPTVVLLQFAAPLTSGTNYQLSVVNVAPVVGNPIPLGSPATASASFHIPPVAISEIMYNSIGPDVEWVELHNTTSATMNVGGWYLTDDVVYPALTEGGWTLPAGTQIPPRGHIVVGLNDDVSAWNFPPYVPLVMPVIVHGGNLKNSGDTVALYTAASGGTLMDGSHGAKYPDLAVAGRSIEKMDEEFQWSGNALAWRQCSFPIPWTTPAGTHATPGWKNGGPLPDTSPPGIAAIEFVSRNRMVVWFDRTVERPGAELAANFTVDYAIGHPTTATLQTSPTAVLLQFSANLAAGTNYQLSVVNVKPLFGNPIPQASPAVANASFRIPPVAITEVMYDSIGTDVEWIELHNTTNAEVNVSGWYLTDDHVYPHQSEGGWVLPASTRIPAGDYVVVGLNADMSGWNFPAFIPLVRATIFQAGALGNGGDTLALYNAASGGTLIDGSLSAAYPALAVAGRSIEKMDEEFQWSGHPLAWRQCAVPIPWTTALGTHASPGRRNGSPPPDVAPPAIASVEFVARNRMVVTFNKLVVRAGAEAVANYTADHGAGRPTSATLQANGTSVLLQFTGNLSAGVIYLVSAVNVQSLLGIAIPAGSPATGSASFRIPTVAISEVMYDCIGTDIEWVELHNTTNAVVDVSGWYLTEDGAYPAPTEGYWILPALTRIEAHGYIVVGLNADMSGWRFPVNVALVRPLIGRAGDLNNAGDNLALYTAASGGALADGSLSVPFPALAVAGRSIEKMDEDFQWSGHPLAWRQCAIPIGWTTALGTHATPGRRNGAIYIPASTAARRWTLY